MRGCGRCNKKRCRAKAGQLNSMNVQRITHLITRRNYMKRIANGVVALLALIVFGLLPNSAVAASEESFVSKISYGSDPTNTQTVEQMAARAAQFKTGMEVIALGYTTDATWVRVEVKPSTLPQLVLSVQPAFLDYVQLYSQAPDGTAWHMQQKGDRLPFLERDRKELCATFTIVPSKTESTVHYLRIQMRGSTLFRVTVRSEEGSKDWELIGHFVTGGYVGLLVLLALSALMQYLVSRDGFWLGGIAFYLTTVVTVLTIMGYMTKYVMPHQTWFLDIVVHELFWAHSVAAMYAVYRLYRYYGAPLWTTWTHWSLFITAPFAMVAIAFGYILPSMKVNAVLLMIQALWGVVPLWYLRGNDRLLINLLRGTLIASGIYFVVYIVPFLGLMKAQDYNVYPAIPSSFFIAVSLHLVLMRRGYLASLDYQQEQKRAQQLSLSLAFEQQKRQESASFLSMLLHELKTPLASIRLAVITVLKDMAGMHPAMNERVRTIEQSIGDINHVLERALETDKLEQGSLEIKKSTQDIAQILTDRIALQDQAERFELHMTQTVQARVDGYLLGLMVSNLLNNAQAYSAPESEIDVSAWLSPAPKGVTSEGESARLLIVVKNLPGKSGFPDSSHLFEKYYRSPRAQFHTGTGLGLYWVQGVLKLKGGICRYYQENGKVVFEIEVPC